jgi:hypothetical protein
MKKTLFLLVAICFALAQMSAQEPTFVKGDKVVNVGVGIGSVFNSGTYYTTLIPPLAGSVGPYLGFAAHKYVFSQNGWRYSSFILGARGNFHYPLVDKLDTYTGLLLAYRVVTATDIGNPTGNPSSSVFTWSWYVGARYYFKERLAAMAELGYGISYLNIGIAYKIKYEKNSARRR